ncbi:valine--tRNA ligase [Blattabacterium cuenoti]|uniref:valine--tRNA ligase n=1 Tax=Blattabacterium cuenoti TaxID=1653831 RepID=UPI00163BE5CA|nr:valine--tRNA ligase [Blattabacterium cuenoti]
MDISIKFDPNSLEKRIYSFWIKNGYFSSYSYNNNSTNKQIPYAMIMPPPNVTGHLHIGHFLNVSIQDILIRNARMKGYNACWVPGTDHASIATEYKVVDQLKNSGLSKFVLGRKNFLSHVFDWSIKHKKIIYNQLKLIGCSCDWTRMQFTMDNKLSQSVQKIFIDLYQKGYIYRGYNVVNWDTEARTTISDEEVFYQNQKSKLYHIKYQITGENNFINIATTRPETIFGDSAIGFHPKDERFYHINNKKVIIPIVNRVIPIIQDDLVNSNFGTGCVKITPAHDMKDKIMADKHKLDIIDIFEENGTLNDKCLHYQGLNRYKAREKIVQELYKYNMIVYEENINHKIGFSERTKSIVEKKLSIQWFLKMKELSIAAINAVKNGEIQFYPNKIKKLYFKWMNNIHDWNISRQLWWGHRIPVYYYGHSLNDFVVANNLDNALTLAKIKSNNVFLKQDSIWQDNDVLDTWFSSWILPISAFNGILNPNNQEINYYFPTEILVTGSDILFFWVARMIIASYLFNKNKPFKTVYFTGLIRDAKNQKISKSLKNFPDSVKLINKYGADAVRMGIILKSSFGKDFHFDEKIFLQGRNFANKIWNAFRLIKNWKIKENNDVPEASEIVFLWFHNRFYRFLEHFDKKFNKYQLNEAMMLLYKIIWNDFCSIYLEIIKPNDKNNSISKKEYSNTIMWFERLLKLLHPYMPFITEEIWNLLKPRTVKEALIISSWPNQHFYDPKLLYEFDNLFKLISKIRDIKHKANISNKTNMSLFIYNDNKNNNNEDKYYSLVLKLANLSKIQNISYKPKNEKLFSFFLEKKKFFLHSIEPDISSKLERFYHVEITKIEKKMLHLKKFLLMIQNNLSNEKYIQYVPKTILYKEKKKEKDIIKKIQYFNNFLKKLL